MTRRLLLALALVAACNLAPAQGRTVVPAAPDPGPAAVTQVPRLGPSVADMLGPKVDVRPSKAKVPIGEPFVSTVTLPKGMDAEDLSIELGRGVANAFVFERVTKLAPGKFEVRTRALRPGNLATGNLIVRIVPVSSGEKVPLVSEGFALEVEPPSGEATMKFEDFTKERSLAFNYVLRNLLVALGVAVTLLVLGGIGYLLVHWARKRRLAAAYVPPVPPIETALAKVRVIKTLDYFVQHGPDVHYTQLSGTIREYIEHQLGIGAMEMTEDEVIDLFRGRLAGLPRAGELPVVLQRSSLAKFAKQDLTREIALADCEAAEAFLVEERRRLEQEERAARAAGNTPPASRQERPA